MNRETASGRPAPADAGRSLRTRDCNTGFASCITGLAKGAIRIAECTARTADSVTKA